MSKAYTNGNKHDQQAAIPYTPACYNEVTDTDYPIPMGWEGDTMVYDIELAATIARHNTPTRGN